MAGDKQQTRARLEMEESLRRINSEVIHNLIPELSAASLEPYFQLVARARAQYIKALVDLADQTPGLPAPEKARELAELRRVFDELIHGAQAIEAALDRGYIEARVKGD